MVKTALIVLEILIGVVALAGEVYVIMAARHVFTSRPGLTPEKTRAIVDIVLLDTIVIVMFVAAWQVVTEGSAARWLSVVAGAAAAAAFSGRPSLTGERTQVASVLTIAGLVVLVLGVFLPSPG